MYIMVEYKCDKCNKKFNHKGDFSKHTKRKFSCVNEDSEILNDPSKMIKMDFTDHTEFPDNKLEIINNTKSDTESTNETDFHCKICDKKFSSHSNLIRHQKKNCNKTSNKNNEVNVENTAEIFKTLLEEYREKIKLSEEKMARIIHENEEKINKLATEVRKLKKCKKSTNVKNSNNNINNTANIGQLNQQNNINVKLVAFKKEDLSFITDDVYKKILNKGFMSVPTLVEYIHFNKDKPQYRNIYISNMRDKYALVFDGENWQLRDREMVLKELIDDKTEVLSLKFEEMIQTLDEFTIRKFQRFLDEGDDDDTITKIKDDLRMVLYNNRKMTEDTKYRIL